MSVVEKMRLVVSRSDSEKCCGKREWRTAWTERGNYETTSTEEEQNHKFTEMDPGMNSGHFDLVII